MNYLKCTVPMEDGPREISIVSKDGQMKYCETYWHAKGSSLRATRTRLAQYLPDDRFHVDGKDAGTLIAAFSEEA